jgi:hypothetical protein
MKSKWSMAVAVMVAASCAMAATNEVTSVNVVGFNRIAIPPNGMALVTLNFESFGNSTLQDLIGDQLAVNSKAYIWDRASNTYVGASRTRGGWSATNVIMRGDAFWLKPAASATTNYVTFMGEAPAAYNQGQSTTIFGISGMEAVGYAYPTDLVWTNTALAKVQTQVNDKLYIWNVNTQGYDGYSKTRGGWSTPAGFTIPAGRAFWLKTSVTIDWTEDAPYSL